MLLSYNWLKKHVDLSEPATPDAVGARLKAATVEVEKMEKQGSHLAGIVVGRVVSCESHPNADKLKVCVVDVGREKLQIVCGGSNVLAGMKVAVATVGASVRWHGEGDLVEMKPIKIRGVESFGMICASTEIGLAGMFPLKEEKEILDLSSVADNLVGEPLARALGLNDVIFEIDNKSLSHRSDLWGHYGMAREVAVLFNKNLKIYKTIKIKNGKEIKLAVKVADSALCPRYMAVAISGIKVGESPEWLKRDLAAVGVRSVNNIVDITNYVMLDLGQPMHAFSAAAVKGGKIIVRNAKDKENFAALNGHNYVLDSNDLVIADEEKVLALAGVMGGAGSSVGDDTTTVIFESANFVAASLRRTSNRLALRTDSAIRFEKSLDPNLCETALAKAVELTLQLCEGATVASKVSDVSNFVLPVGPLEISTNIFRNKLGVIIPDKDIVGILTRLGFDIKNKAETLAVKIPTWRASKDVSIVEDLVEEVARVYGFDNIPPSLPVFPINPPERNELRRLERRAHDILAQELGYAEVYNYSFVSGAQVQNTGDDLAKYIELDNPLSKEKPYLRRSLLPYLLENIKNNIENYPEVKIFEIGKVYFSDETGARIKANSDKLLPKQDSQLTVAYAGKKDSMPFWQARRAAEVFFSALNVVWETRESNNIMPWEHPARFAKVVVQDREVGEVYELNPSVGQKCGLETKVGIFTVNLNILNEILPKAATERVYRPVRIYPEIVRDVAFLVNREVEHKKISEMLVKIDPLVEKVDLFDVYEGKGVVDGYKSMAYHLACASPERTLTSEEVDKILNKAIKALEEIFGAKIRAK